jgi:hypothetical protein
LSEFYIHEGGITMVSTALNDEEELDILMRETKGEQDED